VQSAARWTGRSKLQSTDDQCGESGFAPTRALSVSSVSVNAAAISSAAHEAGSHGRRLAGRMTGSSMTRAVAALCSCTSRHIPVTV